MKISALQENLKTGIFIVSHIAGKNLNLPILNNILIQARDNEIKLIATDLEMGIVSKIRGKIDVPGDYTVNSKLLSDYISLLPNTKVNLEKEEKGLKVVSDNYKTLIKGQESEDYPLIPKIEKNIYFKINPTEFKKALSQVIFSVSNSDNRLELTGVLFDFQKNNLTLASTDSFRLSEKKVSIKTNLETEEDVRIIVPAKTIQEVIRILSTLKDSTINSVDSELVFYISDNQILFSVNETELVSKLIEGQYPDYKQIIPTEFKTNARVSKSELIRAIKAASLFSKTGVNDINIDLPEGQNKIIISSTSSVAGENITEVDAKITGNDNGIVVNFKYLLDGINNIDSDQLELKFINNSTPCVLKAEGKDDYFYIIMPIKQ